jgi:hypothetical protein
VSGECQCAANHYRPVGTTKCLPCDCYYPTGASSPQCHPTTGQCDCRSINIVTRTCDSCRSQFAQITSDGGCEGCLSPLHLSIQHCVVIVVTDKCPARYDAALLWPATALGHQTLSSCPHGARGTARRYCMRYGWIVNNED